MSGQNNMNKNIVRLISQIVIIVFVIIGVIWLNRLAIDSEFFRNITERFGYIGMFFAAIASGFNLLVPIPIIGFFPFFVDIGLSPILIILTISVGMMIGDAFGYLIGKAGRNVVLLKNRKMVRRLEKIQTRYSKGPIVIMWLYASFVPLPNEVLVIPMGFLGYKLRNIMIAVFFGNILFNSLVAFGIFKIFWSS